MAIISTKEKSTLKLKYTVGVDESGKDIFKTFSVSNLKADLEDESLFNLSSKLTDIQKFTTDEIKRVDETIITG